MLVILEKLRKILSETKTVMVVANGLDGLLGTARQRLSSDAGSDIGAPIKRSRSIFMNTTN
ncbi:MAG: hypothetical protein QNJ41_07270 [Xenococcaceae cyanobacterium MO_188.B32]|nr:hypothetical protein [Xenococcaceae cyanobacterium MO_188.B32]